MPEGTTLNEQETEAQMVPSQIRLAVKLLRQADLAISTGQYKQARQLLQEALEVKEALWGAKDPSLIQPLIKLAQVASIEGALDKAEKDYGTLG